LICSPESLLLAGFSFHVPTNGSVTAESAAAENAASASVESARGDMWEFHIGQLSIR
jgi:hypothetical protein